MLVNREWESLVIVVDDSEMLFDAAIERGKWKNEDDERSKEGRGSDDYNICMNE